MDCPGTLRVRAEIFGTVQQHPLSSLSTFPGKLIALARLYCDTLVRTPSTIITIAAAAFAHRQKRRQTTVIEDSVATHRTKDVAVSDVRILNDNLSKRFSARCQEIAVKFTVDNWKP